MKSLIFLMTGLLLIGCNQEEKRSGPTQTCISNCNVKPVVSFDKVRGDLHQKILSYEVDPGEKREIGLKNIEFISGQNNINCHYKADFMYVDFERNHSDTETLITREMGEYELGEETTDLAENCHEKSSGVDTQGKYLETLDLYMNFDKYLGDGERTKVSPRDVTHLEHKGFSIYKIVFSVKGKIGSSDLLPATLLENIKALDFDGTVTIYFAEDVPSAGAVIGYIWNGVSGQTPVGFTEQIVTSIDGVRIDL